MDNEESETLLAEEHLISLVLRFPLSVVVLILEDMQQLQHHLQLVILLLKLGSEMQYSQVMLASGRLTLPITSTSRVALLLQEMLL